MKKNIFKPILILALSVFISACGTTSGLKTTSKSDSGEDSTSKTASQTVDLSSYKRVAVVDFTDGTKKKNIPEFETQKFADIIAAEIKGLGLFEEVNRISNGGDELIISGQITRYNKGNATMRALVGFGAGSSYFDSVVQFIDAQSSEKIGEIVVDKNSWGLGGFVAAGQTVESFMDDAAAKIAKEVKKSKTESVTQETE